MRNVSLLLARLGMPIVLLLLTPAVAQAIEDPAAVEAEARAAAERAATIQTRVTDLERELARLNEELRLVAADRSRGEEAALRADEQIARLETREARLSARVSADEESLRQTFAALVRIQGQRPPVLTAASNVEHAATTSAALSAIAPALQQRARSARRELEELQRVRESLRQTRDALTLTEQGIARRRAQIMQLIEDRTRLIDHLRADADRQQQEAAALSAKARDLRELIDALARQRARDALKKRPPSPGVPFKPEQFLKLKGKLTLPVVGDVVAGYNASWREQRRPGITIRTRRGAQVVAPSDGRVEYAGPFGGYGSLVLIEVGDGHFLALTGMTELFTRVGQAVLAGEPLGEMSDARGQEPELYLELRDGKGPLDPAPWFKSR